MKLMARQEIGARDRIAPRFLSMGDGSRLVHLLRHERNTGTIVQLIAARTGEGTSSLVRDLALVAALTPGMRVLLLDLSPPGNRQLAALRDEFDIPIASTKPLISPPADVVAHWMALGDLHVSETIRAPATGVAGWVGQLPALRSNFDLVLIDSPAIDRSYDGVMLAPDLDTSLLVVEAEKTRSALAQRLRDSIADAGGAIGGVVLNKRRFHVPGIIYRRL